VCVFIKLCLNLYLCLDLCLCVSQCIQAVLKKGWRLCLKSKVALSPSFPPSLPLSLSLSLSRARARARARPLSLSLSAGGLGKWMEVNVFEVYVCVEEHECSTHLDPWFCW